MIKPFLSAVGAAPIPSLEAFTVVCRVALETGRVGNGVKRRVSLRDLGAEHFDLTVMQTQVCLARARDRMDAMRRAA